jgi:DNA-binding protein YbaB
MFDNLKAMGALAGLMKNQDKLRETGERVRAKMDAARFTGEAGSGAARAVVSGSMKVIEVTLAPALVTGMAADERTREIAGRLIADAVNDAISRAQEALKETVEEEARTMGLEGLPGLSNLLG